MNAAGQEGFNSQSTMFLCNRWDMVPEGDRDAVKRDTLDKLARYFTDIKSEQVHHMSLTEVRPIESWVHNTDTEVTSTQQNFFLRLIEMVPLENTFQDVHM